MSSSNKTGFRQGRLGIGKEPIFPLDISGSMRIDGDLVLAGTIADAQGNPIEFGASSATFNMDKTFPDPTIAITEFPDWSGNVVVEGAGKFEDIVSKNGDIFYNGGNVGIGTNSPGYKLEVNGNTHINGTLSATTLTGNLAWSYITSQPTTISTTQASNITTNNAKVGITTTQVNNITTNNAKVSSQWTTTSSSKIYYNGGNVGIGTTSPAGKLSITHSGGSAATPDSNKDFCIYDHNNCGLYSKSGTSTNGTTISYGLSYWNGSSAVDVDNALVLRNYSGENRVGIGTTSPGSILEVYDNSAAGEVKDILHVKNSGGYDMVSLGTSSNYNSGAISLYQNSTTKATPSIVINSNGNTYFNGGNVGIGTTTPGYKLHIVNETLNNNIQDMLCIETHTQASEIGPAMLFRQRWNNGSYWNTARIAGVEGSSYGGQLVFYTNNGGGGSGEYDTVTEKMRIDMDGNVGIGTATLASTSSGNIKLDVHENGTTGWRGTGVFGNQNQKVIIGVHSNVATIGGHNQALTAWTDLCLGFGNVGIGTTSPAQQLDVQGHISIAAHPTQSYVSGNSGQGGAWSEDPNGCNENSIMFYNRYYTYAGGGYLTGSGTRGWHNFIVPKYHSSSPYSGSAGYHAFLMWTYTGHHGTSDYAMRLGSGNGNATLWVNGSTTISSDRRIKTNITDVPDNLALEMVRKIPCRYYEYKRDIYNEYEYAIEKPNRTIGFIAQEVKEIFPEAVEITDYKIPFENNIYNDLNIIFDNSKNFIIITDYSNNELIANDELECIINPINSNNINPTNYKEYADIDNNKHIIHIKYISDSKFEILDSIDNLEIKEILIKNKKVDDFHTLDKQKLFALNFSATQELDRKVIALENENAELKNKNTALENKVTTLESTLETVLARLTELENK